MKIKALITGSEGVLGRNLVPRLQEDGIETVEIDTRKKSGHAIDIRNTDDVIKKAQGCGIVIHAAAALPSYPPSKIWSIDVGGTRSMLNAAKAVGIRRFIHISTTAVYGLPKVFPTPEEYPREGVDPYSKAKGCAEIECERMAEYFDEITIIRPKTFLGPGRLGIFHMLFDWASDGRDFPVLGTGKQLIQMLDVADLCEVLQHIVKNPSNRVRAYNIAAANYSSIEEEFQAILDEAGKGGKIRHIPMGTSVRILKLVAAYGRSPVYPRLINKLCDDSYVDISRARKELEFHPKYSSKQSLVRTYQWWTNQPINHSPVGIESTASWSQGVLQLCKPLF